MGRAEVSAALARARALRNSRDRCGVQGWEQSQDRASGAAWLVCCPSFPALMARIGTIPTLPEGSCCPTQQRCIRRTRRRTSLLLYTNRAGIRTQCCPRQEGGRQTEREGDIREVLRADCDSTEENDSSRGKGSALQPCLAAERGTPRPSLLPPAGSVSPQEPAQTVSVPRPGVRLGQAEEATVT